MTVYPLDKFLKSLTQAERNSLEANAFQEVKSLGFTEGEIQDYATTQLPKRGNKKILYAWALLNHLEKMGWTKAQTAEWEQKVIGWTKG